MLRYNKFIGDLETMQEQTINFLNQYLTEVNGEIFWKKCQIELSFRKEQ